ncbi:MAG TPA: pitrilysin family protein [Candidatus Acidoferrales bacterium]|jgi:zinc protease|nr:pitrilysin family protein [Candidatus Acidoferrales bacterium]
MMSNIHKAKAFLLAGFVFTAAVSSTTSQAQEILRDTLPNGMQVIIVRNTIAPVVTTMVNYRVGSDQTPAGFPGSAHATEHMMFRGSPGLSADQLAAASAAMGGNDNADTQQAVTQYFFTTPAENLDVPLRIEAARMQKLLPDEKLWEKERGAIEQEVAQDLSNPVYVFYKQLLEAMFAGSPYEHDALGTRPSFDKTTGADLRKFHDDWYAPNNAILVIVGDVQPDQALAQVKDIFGKIPSKKLPARPEYNFSTVKPATLHTDTDLPYGMTAVVFRFPGSDNPDFAAAQILSDVLSSERGKLYGLVPEGKAIFAQFEYETLIKSGLGYAIAGFPTGGDPTNLLGNVNAILQAELTNGVEADLVEAAKRREIISAELSKNSIQGLANAWSSAVAIEGRNSPDDDINAIRAVTVDDVNRVAKKYLDFDHAITAILTPQDSGKPISSKSFGGAENFGSSKNPNVKLPSWAKKLTDKLPEPVSTLNPFTTNLPNGIKLIVQPESVSGTVSVHGRVKNNAKVQAPAGKDGVDRALDELFSYGTTSLDRLAFQKALDDIGANESAGTDFSLEVLPENFARGVQLLADNVLSPALPEADFKIIQTQLAAKVAGELSSPDHIAGHALTTALFPKGDPAQREASPDSVKALTIDDVKNYYTGAFRPDLTTIVVIGKISTEDAVAAIEKNFGGWKADGEKPDTLFPVAPDNAKAITQVPDAARVQDKITLAHTMAITRTNADYYALQLGNHVLGGGFYATRLYRDLREKGGLVYYVGSSFNIGETRGVYQSSYACDPQNVAKARTLILRDLKQMQTEKVTDQELHQAKLMLLRDIPLAEASVGDIAGGWLGRSTLGLPLDEPVRAGKIYAQLGAKEVQAAFAKWLRPDDFVQVTQGPEPH